MSFLEVGRDPIWGCGVWPRWCCGNGTPLGMGGDADGVVCRMCGKGCPWKCGGIRWPSMTSTTWGGVPSTSSSDPSSAPPLKSEGPLCSFGPPCCRYR